MFEATNYHHLYYHNSSYYSYCYYFVVAVILTLNSLSDRGAHALDPCAVTTSVSAIWRFHPGRLDYGCADASLQTHCCVTPGHSVTWTKWQESTETWKQVDEATTFVTNRGQRLILAKVDVSNNGDRYKCMIEGTNHSAVKALQVVKCGDACVDGRFIYPGKEEEVTKLPILPGYGITFHCQIFVGCSTGRDVIDRELYWARRPSNGTFMDDVDLHTIPRHIINTTLSDGSIYSQVTVRPVLGQDYDYFYICSTYEGPRYYQFLEMKPPGTVVEPPAKGLVVTPILLPIVLLAMLVVIYVSRYELRIMMHHCARKEANPQILLVNSSSEADVAFITVFLLPQLEGELSLNAVVNFRDFFVSDDDREFRDYLPSCSRVLFVLSNDFLNDPVCNHAFEMANQLNSSNVVFLCLEDLTDWSPQINDVLKERLNHAGKFFSQSTKLIWQPEFNPMPSKKGLMAALKNLKISVELDRFMKRLRLAMPVSSGRRLSDRYELGRQLNSTNDKYCRQSSTASDVVLHF